MNRNISSASKIQRSSNTPLQAETIQRLKDAHKSIKDKGVLPRDVDIVDVKASESKKEGFASLAKKHEAFVQEPPEDLAAPQQSARNMSQEVPITNQSRGFQIPDVTVNFMTMQEAPPPV